MHDPSCSCSAHDARGDIARAIAAAVRANTIKLWTILGEDALLRRASDRARLDGLNFSADR